MSQPEPSSKRSKAGLFQRLKELDRPDVEFFINGDKYLAKLGDTVLTAILTNQTAVRKTEFSGQARAGFCLMGACQDCWVRLGDGQPFRACSTMIEQGMQIVTNFAQGNNHG